MRHVRQAGFTVVEVFMVITLLAVVAGLMVVPVYRIAESMQSRPLEDMVLAAIREAHMQARMRNVSVILSHPDGSRLLQLHTRDGTFLSEILIEPSAGADEGSAVLSFHPILPEDPSRNEYAYEDAEDAVDSIVFHPTGASMPFAVDIGDGRNLVRLVLDPFSSEPVVREKAEDRT